MRQKTVILGLDPRTSADGRPRVEPGDDGALTVTFGATESPRVIGFLQDMTRSTTATISAFDIEAVDSGEVEARITLRPGA